MQYNDIKAKYLSAMCHTFHYILIQINLLHKVQKSVSPAAKIRRVQTRGNLIREGTCLIYKDHLPFSIHQSAVQPRGKFNINLIQSPASNKVSSYATKRALLKEVHNQPR